MKRCADKLTGAIILIGLGFLFLTGSIFPGILFVVGIALLVKGILTQRFHELRGAFVLFAVWFVFAIGFNIGLLLILIGVGLLVGALSSGALSSEPFEKLKRKNEESWLEKAKNDV